MRLETSLIIGTTSVSVLMRHPQDCLLSISQYFFGPRRMEAVLCQGSERLSGRDGAAPLGYPSHLRSRASSRSSSSSSSSSSSDSGDDRNRRHRHDTYMSQGSSRSDKRQRHAERRMAKAQRRQEKRARKFERRAGKACGNNRERYQMFIQPI